MSNRIAFRVPSYAPEKCSVAFVRRFQINVLVEQLAENSAPADVPIEGSKGQLPGLKLARASRPSPNYGPRVNGAYPSTIYRLPCEITEGSRSREGELSSAGKDSPGVSICSPLNI